MAYMRTSRPKTPVIYGPDERFPIGGSKIVRQSANDKAAVIGAGVTLFEALKAYDVLKAQGIEIRVIDAYSLQPVDVKTMTEAGRATAGAIITVEDHYASGGLGDAVSEAVAPAGFTVRRLAVREIPRSGQPDELLDRYGISSAHCRRGQTDRRSRVAAGAAWRKNDSDRAGRERDQTCAGASCAAAVAPSLNIPSNS